MIGKAIRPYRVEKKIGEGGMGQVDQATDSNFEQAGRSTQAALRSSFLGLEESVTQRMLGVIVVWLVVWCGLGLVTQAQQPPSPAEPTQQDEDVDATTGDEDGEDAADDREEQIKPYSDVITADAVSDDGIFTVHQVDDKVSARVGVCELDQKF